MNQNIFDLSLIRYVFFDAGNTLIVPHPSVGEIYAEAARIHGRTYDASDLQERYKFAAHEMRKHTKVDDGPPYGTTHELQFAWWRDLVGMVFPDWIGRDGFDPFFEYLFDDMGKPERFRFLPGALETIDGLKERGMGVGLISNWDTRLRNILDGMGLSKLLSPIYISAEIGIEKPCTQLFQLALNEAGIDGRQAIYVGDSWEWDVCGSRAASMIPILIGDDPDAPVEDDKFLRVNSLIEILDLL